MRGADMPFDEDGVSPDLIFNPMGFPKRMTISQLIEQVMGIICAKKGAVTDATIFRPIDEDQIQKELESYGFSKHGYSRLYNGITGEFIDTMVYMGPCYYQRLQKFVMEQIYAISKGPVNALTRQPVGGKANHGGLKLGEMEMWCLEAHGAVNAIYDKFYHHSDEFTEYICRTCGKAAIVNAEENLYRCKTCKDNADICKVPTSYSAKLFHQELEASAIGRRRMLDPFVYEVFDE